MSTLELSDIILNLDQTPLDINKHIRDLDHSKQLEEKSFVFNDGDDQYANVFLFKVGVNGNGFGFGLGTADQRSMEFLNNDIIVDPFGITHKNGMRTKEFIEKVAPLLSVGKITKILKYDTDNDGKYDFFRGIGDISKDPEKRKLYNNALAAGINETSPTVQPLNLQEDVTNMLTWKPLNVAFVKDGAYFHDAKIKAVCKGGKTSCHNALAAALAESELLKQEQQTHTPLINVLTKSLHMADPEGKGNPDGNVTGGQNQNQSSSPLVNIFTSNPPINNGSRKGIEGNEPPAPAGDQPPNPNNPAETKEDPEKEALKKEVAEYKERARISMLTEMAPLDLFEGKEDEQKAFIKQHKDLKMVEEIYNFNKDYIPKFIKFWSAEQAKKGNQAQNKPADQQGKEVKKEENPLAAALSNGFPNFNNDPNASAEDINKRMYDALNGKSLEDLVNMKKKLESSYNSGVIE